MYVFLNMFTVYVLTCPSSNHIPLNTKHLFLDFYFLPFKMINEYLNISTTVVLFVILPLFYFIYYHKFRYFVFDQRDKVTKGKTSRGKCPPFFPNGKTTSNKHRLIITKCTHCTQIHNYIETIEYHLYNIMIDRRDKKI